MSSSASGPIFNSIESKLNSAFNPIHLDIINESYMHNVPKGSETHFKVVVVSEKFKEMKSLIQKHRAVNEVLSEELSNGVHALSIVAKTPDQWNPDCEILKSWIWLKVVLLIVLFFYIYQTMRKQVRATLFDRNLLFDSLFLKSVVPEWRSEYKINI